MKYIIRLIAMSTHRSDVLVQAPSFDSATIFKMDRAVRETTALEPSCNHERILRSLEASGFVAVDESAMTEDDCVYVHGRAWDEHLAVGQHTFFVAFPEDAPFELASKIHLATTKPNMFALVSENKEWMSELALINDNHEVIYSTDTAYVTEQGDERVPIGPVLLPLEQFHSEQEIQEAKRLLLESGFVLANDEALA